MILNPSSRNFENRLGISEMRYLAFRIKKFKGIRETTIDLRSSAKIRAFSLIGLNESGKTTLLQAIYSFSPDPESHVLFSTGDFLESNKDDLIPRGELSDFSDEISVDATVSIEPEDLINLKRYARNELGLKLQTENIPSEFEISSVDTYVNSKHKNRKTLWEINFEVKSGRQRKFRNITREEWLNIIRFLRTLLPTISYFPIFVFDFPKKIYLSGHEDDKINNFYKKIFQDILDYQGEGLNIEDHIVNRVRADEYKLPWVQFFPTFFGSGEDSKIDQVIDKASAAVSQVIFSKWNEIFKEKSENKEIIIEWKPEDAGDEGDHNVFITFRIKDGANRYDISDRSLGFRWFFCFLLFTQFRAHRKNSKGTLFLFDEPASNLHAKAQEKLLESFPKICEAPNALIYSTHSHNLVEPRWLEHAYIVENKAIDYDENALAGVSYANKDIDIKAIPYRQFVSENPGKTSYFQPILDKLEVRPSRFDLRENCVILEGKSDFYIISYFSNILEDKSLPLIPGLGATTLDCLIALLRGWNFRFYVLLDSDGEGNKAKTKYREKYFLNENEIGTISELIEGIKEIEKMLGEPELNLIAKHYKSGKRPTKKQIMRFFQEKLSTNSGMEISAGTKKRFITLFSKLNSVFDD